MIDDLKPYPAMKDSGVPWLGPVPEHWRVPRLGTLLRERGETNQAGRITDVLSVTRERGVIPYAEKGNVGNKKSDDITRYKIVRPDDIVVNCMNVIIGSVGLSRYTGCLSPVYYVLTRHSEHDDPRYFNAYFQTKPFQESLVRIGNGILAHRMRIPMDLLKSELFPRPPADEQAAIVRFLDHADRRIRRYIRAKQKLIKLLEEQKQAIIHRAVTRGLDPSVRLKPSGVEWLGDVPEHWEVVALRWYISIGSGEFIAAETVSSVSNEQNTVPIIGGNGIMGYGANSNTGNTTIVIGRVGALCGNVHLVVGLAWVTDNALRVTRMKGFEPEYLALQLRTSNLNRLANAQPLITGSAVKEQRVVKPPREDQRQIVRAVNDSTVEIDAAIGNATREISLLREYRTRLIADVVTGKLDVREAAARLPDEADELEPLDAPETEGDVDQAGDADAVPEEAEA